MGKKDKEMKTLYQRFKRAYRTSEYFRGMCHGSAFTICLIASIILICLV